MELLLAGGVILVAFIVGVWVTNNWFGGILAVLGLAFVAFLWFAFIGPFITRVINAPCPPNQVRNWGVCQPDGVIVYFAATPNEVEVPGQEVTLSWETQNATEVTLDGKRVEPSDFAVVNPDKSTTYKLVAQRAAGGTSQKTVTVRVRGTKPNPPGGSTPVPGQPTPQPTPKPGDSAPAPGTSGFTAEQLDLLLKATARADGNPGSLIQALDALWPKAANDIKSGSELPGGTVEAGRIVWTNWLSDPPKGVKEIRAQGAHGVFAVCTKQTNLANGHRSIQAEISRYCK